LKIPIFPYFKYFPILFENIAKALALSLPLFLILTQQVHPLGLMFSRALVLYVVVIIIFIKRPLGLGTKKPWLRFVDYILVMLTIGVAIWSYFELDKMYECYGMAVPLYQIIIGTLATIIIFEATRRVAGPILPIMALMLIGYALYRGYSFPRIMAEVFSYDGIFGFAFAIAITVVFTFILLGSLLNQANFGTFLLKLGTSLVGGMSGGPAKVAIVSSSLFGTISGSAVANVAGTGTFTIPMMKKLGFEPNMAGAVEASASTGGLIMPPIMAAAAFLIAEILGVPYLEVAKSAILPAVAYYVCVFVSVDAYSKIKGMRGVPKSERPTIRESFKAGGHLLTVLIILIILLIRRMSPLRAAFVSLLPLFLISFLSRETRLTPKRVGAALKSCTEGMLIVASCCATVGSIIACIALTGLGSTIANAITSVGGDNLFLVLLLVMVVCIIFGLALPATASYLVVAAVVGPTLVMFGIVPMSAHLFMLYFAALSGITPPVAMAAYAAAAIAKGDLFKTALAACKITAIAFVIPFMFVYNPSMIFKGSTLGIPFVVLAYVIALPCSLAFGLWGHTGFRKATTIERIVYLGIATSIVYLTITHQVSLMSIIAIIGILFMVISYLIQRKRGGALS
jgi:TRAP transporter 4TM/12TM fusion protein